MKIKSLLPLLLCLCFGLLISCGGGGSGSSGEATSGSSGSDKATLVVSLPSSSMAAAVTGTSALPADINRCEVICSGADMATITEALPLDGTPVIIDITPGTNRVVTINAYNGNLLRMSGSETIASLSAGTTTSVSIQVADVAVMVVSLTPISAISQATTVTTAQVAPSSQITFYCEVTNHVDTSVTWEVDGISGGNSTVGTITSASVYTAPAATGNHTVRAISNEDPTLVHTIAVTVNDAAYGTVTSADGRVWLDRNLGATRVANYSTDTAAYGDLYQWGRGADGHQLRTSGITTTHSTTDTPGHADFIISYSSPYDWRTPQNDNLWQGGNGTNNVCPAGFRLPTEAEWETERASWSSQDAAGAFASPLKLVLAGSRDSGDQNGTVGGAGASGLYWSSTVNGSGANALYFYSSYASSSYYMNRGSGLSVRCIDDSTPILPTISSADGSATEGSDISFVITLSAASSSAVTVDYVSSDGTATAGNDYTAISGTLTFAAGETSKTITVSTVDDSAAEGDETLTVTLSNASNATISTATATGTINDNDVATVTSATGRVWMDRNLGATQVATSSTDSAAYGDLYQWGRGADGHQLRTSGVTSTLSTSDTPGHGDFITASSSPYDWRTPQNDNLWQGVSGTNNVCPAGFRLPTRAEWETEIATWSSQDPAGAYASPLKLVLAGQRYNNSTGTIRFAGSYGYYWSSTVDGSDAGYLFLYSSVGMFRSARSSGFSVRCIEDDSSGGGGT